MIQWYDDRPSEPIAAFIYFETLFRHEFLKLPLSKEGMLSYVWRLLVAKHELNLPILGKWGARPRYSSDEFEDEILSSFQRPFDEDLFLRFEDEILSLLPKLKKSLANIEIFREAALAQEKNVGYNVASDLAIRQEGRRNCPRTTFIRGQSARKLLALVHTA